MEPSNDYAQGQMMGMLCIIRLLKLRGTVPIEVVDSIEHKAAESLSVYLDKPEEDVYLMVDNLLEKT